MPVQHAPGLARGEVQHDHADHVVRRAAHPAVGDVGHAAALVDRDVVEEAALAVGHTVEWNVLDRAAGLEVEHQHLLGAGRGLGLTSDEAHVERPEPAVATVDVEAEHVAQILFGCRGRGVARQRREGCEPRRAAARAQVQSAEGRRRSG
ncbi:hypothetical protein D3C86_1778830 [compost metagenome]